MRLQSPDKIIRYRSNSTTRMTTTKSYDKLNRLGAISSQPAAAGTSLVSSTTLTTTPTSARG